MVQAPSRLEIERVGEANGRTREQRNEGRRAGAGLKIESALDTRAYEKGIKVSDAQMKAPLGCAYLFFNLRSHFASVPVACCG